MKMVSDTEDHEKKVSSVICRFKNYYSSIRDEPTRRYNIPHQLILHLSKTYMKIRCSNNMINRDNGAVHLLHPNTIAFRCNKIPWTFYVKHNVVRPILVTSMSVTTTGC